MAYLKLVVAAIVVVVASSVAGLPFSPENGHPIVLDENLQPIIIVDQEPAMDTRRDTIYGTPVYKKPVIFVDQEPAMDTHRDTIYGPPVHKKSVIFVDQEPAMDTHRDTSYGPPVHKPVHKKKYYTPGKVGPVYTFAKTDYHGNFKWGVRHRAGSQYAGSYH